MCALEGDVGASYFRAREWSGDEALVTGAAFESLIALFRGLWFACTLAGDCAGEPSFRSLVEGDKLRLAGDVALVSSMIVCIG